MAPEGSIRNERTKIGASAHTSDSHPASALFVKRNGDGGEPLDAPGARGAGF